MRKQTLYARRLRGDIGPLDLDPVRGLMSRIIAPAVSITGEYQDYDEEDITQNFTIGSRMRVDDRVYYYSQAVVALPYPYNYHLVVSTDQVLAVNDMANTTATTVLGRTITLTVGAFQAGVIPANDLEGGWVECWAAGIYAWRRIVSNLVAAGGTVTITVDRPFGQIFAIGSQITIHKSIYKNVSDNVSAGLTGFAPAIGVPPIPITIAYYFWLQTYGPCFIGPSNWPLAVANYYDVYFDPDSEGKINSSLAEGIGVTVSPQRIGHVIGAGNYGTGSVFLELAS